MEKEAVSLLALDEKAAKLYVGRTEGPKFVQRNALENEQRGNEEKDRCVKGLASQCRVA